MTFSQKSNSGKICYGFLNIYARELFNVVVLFGSDDDIRNKFLDQFFLSSVLYKPFPPFVYHSALPVITNFVNICFCFGQIRLISPFFVLFANSQCQEGFFKLHCIISNTPLLFDYPYQDVSP
jgi:hypothetical protein